MAERFRGDIELEGVRKAYGNVVAVDDVSLHIEAGTFFSLLGPSGCGKTTTLRLLGGFLYPDAGEIRIDGRSVVHLPPHRRDVNTVFQQYALFPHMTVAENVAFGLEMRGVPKPEIRKRVAEALEMVGLEGLEERKPAELSGGQQQRVALARALVSRPSILLLDEPLASLDLKLRKRMQEELKALQAEVGITFLYVTHDQEEAMSLSDRIAVMKDGKIQQVGTPEEIYERPRNRFVADFIGTSNFVQGRLVHRNGRQGVVELVGNYDTPRPLRSWVELEGVSPNGNLLTFSLRPERIVLLPPDTAPPKGMNRAHGRIRSRTFLGTDFQYTVRLENGLEWVVLQPNVGTFPRFERDAAVLVAWSPQDMRLLEE
ncbi:MAG: spermidine/putrescine import ATP-binding protein PotA [Candidatus Poribacteria bacterium]|nr:MAG: spermidine/putrescine import ATP-binding protein PotA [Candidatus Poribacteria bacterium]